MSRGIVTHGIDCTYRCFGHMTMTLSDSLQQEQSLYILITLGNVKIELNSNFLKLSLGPGAVQAIQQSSSEPPGGASIQLYHSFGNHVSVPLAQFMSLSSVKL